MHEFHENLKKIKKHATKETCLDFVNHLQGFIESDIDDKLLDELYKQLHSETNQRLYPEFIWLTLLKACIRTWNLDIGQKIISSITHYPSVELACYAAEILLESGKPEACRKLAKKTLRRKSIPSFLNIKLKVLTCRSYAEQNKANKARKMVSEINAEIDSDQNLDRSSVTNFRESLARVYFFLGEYFLAAEQAVC